MFRKVILVILMFCLIATAVQGASSDMSNSDISNENREGNITFKSADVQDPVLIQSKMKTASFQKQSIGEGVEGGLFVQPTNNGLFFTGSHNVIIYDVDENTFTIVDRPSERDISNLRSLGSRIASYIEPDRAVSSKGPINGHMVVATSFGPFFYNLETGEWVTKDSDEISIFAPWGIDMSPLPPQETKSYVVQPMLNGQLLISVPGWNSKKIGSFDEHPITDYPHRLQFQISGTGDGTAVVFDGKGKREIDPGFPVTMNDRLGNATWREFATPKVATNPSSDVIYAAWNSERGERGGFLTAFNLSSAQEEWYHSTDSLATASAVEKTKKEFSQTLKTGFIVDVASNNDSVYVLTSYQFGASYRTYLIRVNKYNGSIIDSVEPELVFHKDSGCSVGALPDEIISTKSDGGVIVKGSSDLDSSCSGAAANVQDYRLYNPDLVRTGVVIVKSPDRASETVIGGHLITSNGDVQLYNLSSGEKLWDDNYGGGVLKSNNNIHLVKQTAFDVTVRTYNDFTESILLNAKVSNSTVILNLKYLNGSSVTDAKVELMDQVRHTNSGGDVSYKFNTPAKYNFSRPIPVKIYDNGGEFNTTLHLTIKEKDTDGDGRIDSEDYAPNDPKVQEENDIGETSGNRTPGQSGFSFLAALGGIGGVLAYLFTRDDED